MDSVSIFGNQDIGLCYWELLTTLSGCGHIEGLTIGPFIIGNENFGTNAKNYKRVMGMDHKHFRRAYNVRRELEE